MAGVVGKPCKEPRCSVIVTGKGKYCDRHDPGRWVSKEAAPEKLSFYYGDRWRHIRKIKLSRNPVCEVCNVRLATQVHHLSKARDDIEGRYEMSNLQSICVWCHAKETQRETLATRLKSKERAVK